MSQLHAKATVLRDAYRRGADEQTGAVVHQLTDDASINHSLFFLTPSFRPRRPEQLAFVTHRGGEPQLALFDFRAQRATVLTDRPGLLPFSPAFAVDGSELFYSTRDGDLWAVAVDTLAERHVAKVPADGVGECAPSPDGRWLVTAYKRGDRHGLFVADAVAGGGETILEDSDLKIIHPQFHPRDSELILYAGDPRPRLWTVRRDGTANRCLYDNGPEEFIVHESFLGGSDELIFAVWPYRLCRMHLNEGKVHTIAELNAWHMASNRDGTRIVTDTAHPDRGLLLVDPETGEWRPLCQPKASCQGTQWAKDRVAGPEVWQALRQRAGADLSWMETQADTVYGPQWTHPHPAFDEAGGRVVFTSDRTGHPQVYVVELPD